MDILNLLKRGSDKIIQRERRIKIWFLIKRISKKLGIIDIPRETEQEYWQYMRQPSETIRWLLIEHYNLDTGFFYHAYEESDLKGKNEQSKMREMFEHYFASDTDDYHHEGHEQETLLLIDVKNLKAYTLTKEIKYTKKAIK